MVLYQYFQKLLYNNSDFIFFPVAKIPHMKFVCYLRANLLTVR